MWIEKVPEQITNHVLYIFDTKVAGKIFLANYKGLSVSFLAVRDKRMGHFFKRPQIFYSKIFKVIITEIFTT